MKYVFYYGIKSIDESYKRETLSITNEDPKVLEQLVETYNRFIKLCKELTDQQQPEQKPNPNIKFPESTWVIEGFGGPLG